MDGKNGDGLNFKNLASFFKVLKPILKAKPLSNVPCITLASCQNWIHVLNLNFKTMFSARLKGLKGGFLYSFWPENSKSAVIELL